MMKMIKMKQRVGVGAEMSTTTNKNKIRESLMRRPCKSIIYIIRSPEDRTWRMLKKKKKFDENYKPTIRRILLTPKRRHIKATPSRYTITILRSDTEKKKNWKEGFLGGPVVKNLSCNAGDAGSIPGRGPKIPRALRQLSLCRARQVACLNYLASAPKWRPSTGRKKKKENWKNKYITSSLKKKAGREIRRYFIYSLKKSKSENFKKIFKTRVNEELFLNH